LKWEEKVKMAFENYVPKTKQDMQKWYCHIEICLRGQAKSFKDDSVQSIDRHYIADGIKYIRMRDFPRFITLPEAQQIEDRIVLVGIPRTWLFQVCNVTRYGQMTEFQYDEIMCHSQTWVDRYKKYLTLQKGEQSTLQEALDLEIKKVDAGLPKTFMESQRSKDA
jgi:hypothetical protein